MHVDPEHEIALVMTIGSGGDETIIASCRSFATSAHAAEVAFLVEEDYQGQGIAGKLLRHLAGIERERGITEFEADVLAENKSMLVVFAKSGFPMRKRPEGGTVHITLSLVGDPARNA